MQEINIKSKTKFFNLITPYLFLLPSAIFIFGLIYYPVLNAIRISFFDYNVLSGEMNYIGLKNYFNIFSDPLFITILQKTLIWTLCVVGGTTIISMLLAWLFNIEFRFKKVVRGIFILPWATSLAISAMLYKWTLNTERGLLNYTLKDLLHLISGNVGWLARASTSFPWLIYVGIWVSVPFTTLVILAGMQGISKELYEASRIDGANGIQEYLRITIPLVKPIILITVLINFIAVFNSFPIIWIMTEGGPINSTDIIVTFLYKQAFKFLDFGKASAMAVIIFIFLLIASLIYMFTLMKESE